MNENASLRLCLLGPILIESEGSSLSIRRRKVLALLAYLAVEPGPHNRDELAELLYPGQDRDHAYSDLRQSLSYLRTALGDGWLETDAHTASLSGRAQVDAHEFRCLLEAPRNGGRAGRLRDATRLYRGRFLQGFYLRDSARFESWQTAQEQTLRRLYGTALDERIEAAQEARDYTEALSQASAALALDELDEASHRRLMLLLALQGKRHEAERQYEQCRLLLKRELDDEPGEDTRELAERIHAGRIGPAPAVGTPAVSVDRAAGVAPIAGRGVLLLGTGANAADPRLEAGIVSCGGAPIPVEPPGVAALFSDLDGACAAALALHADARRVTPERAGGTTPPRLVVYTMNPAHAPEDRLASAIERSEHLLRAAHDGQILVGCAMADPSGAAPSSPWRLVSLGVHHLDDLGPPLSVHRLAHPQLPSRFPPLRTRDSAPGNLRPQSTFLVGRAREIAKVTALLCSDGVRLVTLTGPGGTGKTRLALHAAARLWSVFPHGVFLVDLSAIRDAEKIPSAIGSAVGLTEAPGDQRSPAERLGDYLLAREMLVILDNFEQVVAGAPAVAALLGVCPGLKVLVTSREALHLQGERELGVPPMSLPDPADNGRVARDSEAVRLFVERATAVSTGFALTDGLTGVVTEICRRLDGLPLAIELAAARVRMLPADQILARLSRRMDLLTRGARDLPERQRTLRGEIDWSHDLLTERERIVFRRLAVFPEGCTVESAATVCAPPGEDAASVVDALASLADKSLITSRYTSGHARFTMLETIHEYAREKLASSCETETVRARFVSAEMHLAEEAESGLYGGRQAKCFALLDLERNNLLTALEWLHGAGRPHEGLRLAARLAWYWFRRALFSEGNQWIGRFLDAAGEGADPGDRARALYHLGLMKLMLGGTFYGNPASLDCFRRSLASFRLRGERRGEALCLAWLGWCEVDLSATERCALADRGLAIAREVSDPWTLSFCLKLACSYMQRQDMSPPDKTRAMEDSIRLARETEDPFLVSQSLHGMGDVHMFLRDDGAAEPWYREALEVARGIGDTWSCFDAQSHLAWGYLNRGDTARAHETFAEALRAAAEKGARSYVGQFLSGLASVARQDGDHPRALRLGGAAACIRDGQGGVWDPELTDGTPLPRTTLEREWSVGASMTMDQAVRYALTSTTAAGLHAETSMKSTTEPAR